MPLWERTTARVVLPVYGWGLRLFGTRRMLAEHLAMNDLPEGVDLEDAVLEGIEDLVVDQRDRLLVDALAAVVAERADEPITIGVVYGATHIRAAIRALWTLGFRPGPGEWLTVFRLSQP